MNRPSWRSCTAVLLVAAAISACARAPVRTVPDQPASVPATGASAPAAPAARTTLPDPIPYTKADVGFMQSMIAHHEQALVMAALTSTNTTNPRIRLLAERIEVSQVDEIRYMQRWLRNRKETVPETHAGHDMGAHQMPGGPMAPGMLTAEQLKQLQAARGNEFDRRFLTFMIQHHEGAIVMVKQLFSVPGAGQDIEVFQFASDVDADQTAEIDRMYKMLSAIPPAGLRP